MIQISLSEQTAERLHTLARQRGANVTELLEQIVGRYLAVTQAAVDNRTAPSAVNDQQRIIEQEQQVFAARHQEFLALYPGETIAIHAGKVIDHDVDRVTLSRRTRGRYGNQPILMTPVLPEPIQTVQMRSPHLTDELS
jgi:hypothetical protein